MKKTKCLSSVQVSAINCLKIAHKQRFVLFKCVCGV